MSTYKSSLFSPTRLQIFSLKKNLFGLEIHSCDQSFDENILWSRAQSYSLRQSYDLFFLRPKIALLFPSKKETVSYGFHIKEKKRIELTSQLKVFTRGHALSFCCQSDQRVWWNEGFRAHALAREVTDYLGGAFSIF
jgi:hypothetical protein